MAEIILNYFSSKIRDRNHALGLVPQKIYGLIIEILWKSSLLWFWFYQSNQDTILLKHATMVMLFTCTHVWDTLHWRHDGHDGVSNHQPQHCLLNHLFRRRSKKTSKLRVTGLCEGNSPVTGEFPAQRASNAENVSITKSVPRLLKTLSLVPHHIINSLGIESKWALVFH